MKNVVVFLMAGGKGERFWPWSRLDYPKQLHALTGKKSLLEESWRRALLITKDQKRIFLAATTNLHKAIFYHQPDFPIQKENIILEPEQKNTAAIIALASLQMAERFPQAIQIYLPVDHYINKERNYIRDILLAAQLAKTENKIVTIGIRPTRAETGYGYLFSQPYKKVAKYGKSRIYRIHKFLEKPNLAKAQEYQKNKDIFWNGGIFIVTVDLLATEFSRYAKKIFDPLKIAWQKPTNKRPTAIRKAFRKIPALPIDIAVMEKSQNILMIPASFIWDDLGSWISQERLASRHQENRKENVILNKKSQQVALKAKNNFIATKHKLIALIDVENLFIIEDEDVLLISHRNGLGKIRDLLRLLSKKKTLQKYLKKEK